MMLACVRLILGLGPAGVLLLVWGACLSGLQAQQFAEPDLAVPLLKADRLPLSVETIEATAHNLTVLAARAHNGRARQHRASAQCLALAAQLDPDNEMVAGVVSGLREGEVLEHPDLKAVRRAKSELWSLTSTLVAQGGQLKVDYPEADRLARLLLSTLRGLDASHPLAEDPPEDFGEVGDLWGGSVPPLRHFQALAKAQAEGGEAGGAEFGSAEGGERVPATSAPEGESMEPSPLKLEVAKLSLMVFSPADEVVTRDGPMMRLTSLNYGVTLEEERENLWSLPGFLDVASLVSCLPEAMREEVMAHPTHHISFRVSEASAGRGSPPGALASAVHLLACGYEGVTPPENLLILADLQEDGALRPAMLSWIALKNIRYQRSQEKHIIIYPPGAEKELLGLLSYGDLSTLLRHRIHLAQTREGIAQQHPEHQTPEQKKALAILEGIQKAAPVNRGRLANYVTSKGVRRKLRQIIRLDPTNLSAAALLRAHQLSHEVPERVVLQEVLAILNLCSWVPQTHVLRLERGALRRTAEVCKSRQRALEVLLREQATETAPEVRKELNSLVAKLGTLRRAREDSESSVYADDRQLRSAYQDVREIHTDLTQRLKRKLQE